MVLDAAGAAESEFDALTDLFLGEVAGKAVGRTVDTPAPTAAGATAQSVPDGFGSSHDSDQTPRLRLAQSDEDAAPEPKRHRASGAPLPTRPVEVSIAPAPEAPAPPAVVGEAIVECLVLGHLPVLASAWATQYVREISQAAGRPVAVLRVQAGYASVEVVGMSDAGTRAMAPEPATIEDAIKAASAYTNRWVVRCDPGAEAVAAGRAFVRVVTLLSGGDEAAKVGAYASIKALAEHLKPPTDDKPGPLMRLAVIGSEAQAAGGVGGRIVEAVKQFLGREIEPVVCASRIASTRSSLLLYSGPTDSGVDSLLDALERSLRTAPVRASFHADPLPREHAMDLPVNDQDVSPMPSDAAIQASPPLHVVSDEPEIEPDADQPADEFRSGPVEIRPFAADLAAEEDAEEIRPFVRAQSPAPLPTPSPREAAPAARVREMLSDHLTGLTALPVECPHARGVELALDQMGRLHLLAAGGDESNESSVTALLTAAAWCQTNASLLTFATGSRAVPGLRPAMHLFTGAPRSVRRLLDTDVRVHILAPVRVGERTEWYCAELN